MGDLVTLMTQNNPQARPTIGEVVTSYSHLDLQGVELSARLISRGKRHKRDCPSTHDALVQAAIAAGPSEAHPRSGIGSGGSAIGVTGNTSQTREQGQGRKVQQQEPPAVNEKGVHRAVLFKSSKDKAAQ